MERGEAAKIGGMDRQTLRDEPALGLDRSDEAWIDQKNGLTRQWARRGTRPRQPADRRHGSACLLGADLPRA